MSISHTNLRKTWGSISFADKILFATLVATLAMVILQCAQMYFMSAQLREMSMQTKPAILSAEATRTATTLTDRALNEGRISGDQSASQMERVIGQASVAADAARLSAQAAIKAAERHSEANKLTHEAIRGRLAITNIRLKEPIAVGRRSSVVVEMENIGKTVLFQRSATDAQRWNRLPDGPMPLDWKHAERYAVEPGGRGSALVTDAEPVSEELLRQLEVGQRTSVFFGRFEYETLNERHFVEFCAHLMKMDTTVLPQTGPTETARVDPRYVLRQCSKWHEVK